MNKAILVMDMPDRCWKCSACASWQNSAFSSREYWCCAKDRDVDPDSKPDWCPLREVPKKLEGNDSIYYQWGDYEDGWNHCIDNILDE